MIYHQRRYGPSLTTSAPHSLFDTGTLSIWCLHPRCLFSEAYLGFKGNKLQNHLHSEEASEEHVEDVHGDFKQAALTVVLRGGKNCENEAGISLILTTLISTEIFLEPILEVHPLLL